MKLSPTIRFLAFRDDCGRCSKPMSGLSATCPYCGWKRSSFRKTVFFLYLFVFLAGLGVAGYFAARAFGLIQF